MLVEKPLATSLEEAHALVELSRTQPGPARLRAAHPPQPDVPGDARVRPRGADRDLLSARARYGWAGPSWNEWFYQPGGGSLFDLGVYNVTTLCALFGPARRVTAMVGTAIPEREVNGRPITVEADDNAHVLLDFGDARFGVVTTGFTMQKYRSPAVEVYGSEGTMQMLGDDWAPEGWELWRNEDACLAGAPRERPPLAVDGRAPASRRLRRERHADDHAARARVARPRDHARGPGRRRRRQAHAQIETDFPEPVYGDALLAAEEAHRSHDRRSHDGL